MVLNLANQVRVRRPNQETLRNDIYIKIQNSYFIYILGVDNRSLTIEKELTNIIIFINNNMILIMIIILELRLIKRYFYTRAELTAKRGINLVGNP